MEEKTLGQMISDSQARIKWYNDEMQSMYKNKNYFDGWTEEDKGWWKEHLRWWKNLEEVLLKKMVLEAQYLNSGLNPPSCYRNAKPLETKFFKV